MMTRARLRRVALAVAITLALGAQTHPVEAQTKITMAVPSYAGYLAFGYIAKDMGFWKELGLDVEMPLVAGTAALQALSAGDAQFSISSGPDMIAAVPRGANVIAVAQLFDRLNYQIVLSKAIADKTGLTPANSTVAQRAKALKGLTIAAGSTGGPSDTFLSHLLILGGLDPQKDVPRTVINNSPVQDQMLAAAHIDGFSGGSPFTTIAVQQGTGVNWIDSVRDDVPGMTPFVYSVISASPVYCSKNPDICRKFLEGANKAVTFMKSNRDKAVEIVAANLKGVDPQILSGDFDRQLGIMPAGLKPDPKAWENTRVFDLEVGNITAAMKDVQLEGKVYTDAYLQ